MSISASQFPGVYEDLGIQTDRLGCIMLDTEPIVVSDIIPEDALWEKEGAEDYLKGYVSEKVPHVTLLFGLMRSGQEMRKHVDAVLNQRANSAEKDWVLPFAVEIEKVDFFYAKDPADNYITIVATVKKSEDLLEANARLRLLPHIDTFPEYKPHITLAYVKNTSDWNQYILGLNVLIAGASVKVVGLNYGD